MSQGDDGFELPAEEVEAALGRGIARAYGNSWVRMARVDEVAPEHCPVCDEATRARCEAELCGGTWEPCSVHGVDGAGDP